MPSSRDALDGRISTVASSGAQRAHATGPGAIVRHEQEGSLHIDVGADPAYRGCLAPREQHAASTDLVVGSWPRQGGQICPSRVWATGSREGRLGQRQPAWRLGRAYRLGGSRLKGVGKRTPSGRGSAAQPDLRSLLQRRADCTRPDGTRHRLQGLATRRRKPSDAGRTAPHTPRRTTRSSSSSSSGGRGTVKAAGAASPGYSQCLPRNGRSQLRGHSPAAQEAGHRHGQRSYRLERATTAQVRVRTQWPSNAADERFRSTVTDEMGRPVSRTGPWRAESACEACRR